ncbi:MAG TPA: ZPR1 zinc finger domain-containing protein [Candidatus Nanoarchaeia archaeon]|nr:ZPR1 zinc finger domain-containing protein [Candidatus Nanoarchaeia archaeon]
MAMELKGEECSICHLKSLVLREDEMDIPHFGKCYLLTMKCEKCNYHKTDVEAAEQRKPIKVTLKVDSEEDMNIRVIKSGEATVKIPHIITIEPGPASEGYITNVEGLLARIREAIQTSINDEEDEEKQKKGKKLLKKLTDVTLGRDSLSIIIEDPTGNSGIVSDKAERK